MHSSTLIILAAGLISVNALPGTPIINLKSKSSTIVRRGFPIPTLPLNAADADANTQCNGASLDVSDTNTAYANMISALPSTITTTDHNEASTWTTGDVTVYLCTDQHNSANTFTADMVSTAQSHMNAKCGEFVDSWYIFPGSNAIIGQALSADSICQGSNYVNGAAPAGNAAASEAAPGTPDPTPLRNGGP